MDITQNKVNKVLQVIQIYGHNFCQILVCELKPWQAITTSPIMKRLVAPGYSLKLVSDQTKAPAVPCEICPPESITLRAYSYIGAFEIGLDWEYGTMKSYPLGNVLHNPVHKNISMFPYRDLLSFKCLVLALKECRIYFSNVYRSSFNFPQHFFKIFS